MLLRLSVLFLLSVFFALPPLTREARAQFSPEILTAGAEIVKEKAPVIGKDGETDEEAAPGEEDRDEETEKGGFGITPIPVIIPISDPILGYGAAGAGIVFIHKEHADPILSADGRVRPDLLVIGGFYTSNESKALLGLYNGYWFGDRFRTSTLLAGGTVNMRFFGRDGGFDALGDAGGLAFSGDGFTFRQDARFRLGRSFAFAGLGYNFLTFDTVFELPFFADRLLLGPFDTKNAGLSLTGLYDSRDSRWSPGKGHFHSARLTRFDEAFGGDFDYWHLRLSSLNYWDLPGPFTLGLRFEGQFAGDGVPFYALPSISMRGIGANRYQAENVFVAEAEIQWQFADR